GEHAGNQPARVAQLDHGNDRAILVQGDEGSAQVVWLGHRGTPSINAATKLPFPPPPAPYHLSVPQFARLAESAPALGRAARFSVSGGSPNGRPRTRSVGRTATARLSRRA